MFDRRTDLTRFLAVADTGKIYTAAEQIGLAQPALSRTIARLERTLGGRLFERVPSGVRLTSFGTTVAELARNLLRELEAAEEKLDAVVSGRAGLCRVSADAMWMRCVVPAAVARFHERFPDVELVLETTPRAEGLRRLMSGESDLHCGGIDTGEPLPPFVGREAYADMAWGIVAHRAHPLHARAVTFDALADLPWVDYDAPRARDAGGRPSVADVLEALHAHTGRHARTLMRAASAGLSLMGTGPYLTWLPLGFLGNVPGLDLAPLAVELGACRHATGTLSRRAAEDWAPFRHLRNQVREVALERLR